MMNRWMAAACIGLAASGAYAHEITLDFGALMSQLGGDFGTGTYNASSDLDNNGELDATQANIVLAIGILGDENDPDFLGVHDAFHDNTAIVQDALALVDNSTIPVASKDAFEDLLGLFMTIQGHGGAIAGATETGMRGFVESIWTQFGLTPAFDSAAWVASEVFEETMEGEGEGEHGHEEADGSLVLEVGDALALVIPDPIDELQPIAWEKDGLALADDARTTGSTARTLQISDMTVADSGTYTATYQEHAKHAATYSIEVQVVLDTLAYATGDDLQFVLPSPIAESLPIDWTKDGEPLENGGGVSGVGTRILLIKNLTDEHAGVYQAVYEGHAKHAHTFGPYAVKVVENSQIVLLGEDFEVQIPPPFTELLPIDWTKDGDAMSDGGRISGSDTATLSIVGATRDDAGVYAAEYQHHAKHGGYFESLVRVVSEQMVRYAGGTLSLTIPEPVEESLPITWYRDGTVLADAGRISGSGSRTLQIDYLHASDAGLYWAVYDEHAKHMVTYGPILLSVQPASLAPGVPVAGGAGLAALVAAIAAVAVRRRK
ncbi:MAG: hypothetical protein GC168_18095 [Candidatus Hydrogenedens sp.]|nr:hypothetical protein [Candidatus Hydrogenedens sp.]